MGYLDNNDRYERGPSNRDDNIGRGRISTNESLDSIVFRNRLIILLLLAGTATIIFYPNKKSLDVGSPHVTDVPNAESSNEGQSSDDSEGNGYFFLRETKLPESTVPPLPQKHLNRVQSTPSHPPKKNYKFRRAPTEQQKPRRDLESSMI